MSVKQIEKVMDAAKTAAAVLLSFAATILLICLVSSTPWQTVKDFFLGPFQTTRRIGNVIEMAIPICFTGCGICIMYSTGHINMGSSGYFYIGGKKLMPVGVGFTGYGVARNGDRLELWSSGMEDTFLWTIAEIPGARPAAGTTRWFYAVVDGRELVRMDYYGENRTTVFTDDTGLLGELMFAEGDGGFFLLGEDLTYFLAGTEDGGVGVYRLYLPEDRTDLLYRYTPEQVEELTFSTYLRGERQEPRIQIGAPIPCFRQGLTTNQWVRWETKDPEFYAKYAAMLADSEGNTGEMEQFIEEKFDAAHATLYYADLGEDMLYTMPMSWLDMTGTTHASPFGGCWFDLYLDQERTHRQSLGLANMV